MSLIRIAVPGQPVILVDEGPNTGRTSFTRGAVQGGAIVTTASWREKRVRAKEREPVAKPEKRDDLAGIPRPVCGKTLVYIGEPCARTSGHGWDCKSAEDMARRAAERRADRMVHDTAAEREERDVLRRERKNEWQRERRARIRGVA